MIKNIIFDLGNVIIQNPTVSTLENFTKNREEAEILKKYIFQSQEWKKLDNGLITTDEAIEIIEKNVPKDYTNLIEVIMHQWYKFCIVNEDTIKIAKKLKEKKYSIYVLSNMAIETYKYFKKMDFFDICNGVVISANEKITKPNSEIFIRLLDRYDIKAEETLFIDDDDTNRSIDTANKLGILGRRVEPNNSQDILKLLQEYEIQI